MVNENRHIDRLVFAIVLGLVNGIVMALAPVIGKDGVGALVTGGFAGSVATLSALLLGPVIRRWAEKRTVTKGPQK